MSHRRRPYIYRPEDHLSFLLSPLFDGLLAPGHRDDLYASALSDETIQRSGIGTVPPDMLRDLVGSRLAAKITSAYAIPYPDLRGGWLPLVRLRVFPPVVTKSGQLKYWQPKGSEPRIYFPILTLDAVVRSDAPLWVAEGEKKAMSLSQTGEPCIGIAGCEGWHLAGRTALHPDLDDVGLTGRVVNLWLDADVASNPMVRFAADRLVSALRARGVTDIYLIRSEVTA
jgi:hypothetical protein